MRQKWPVFRGRLVKVKKCSKAVEKWNKKKNSENSQHVGRIWVFFFVPTPAVSHAVLE